MKPLSWTIRLPASDVPLFLRILREVAEEEGKSLAGGSVDSRPFPIQAERTMPDIPRSVPWWIAERAYREYSRLYGDSQSLERLAERGGFAWAEIGIFLAADLQRHPNG